MKKYVIFTTIVSLFLFMGIATTTISVPKKPTKEIIQREVDIRLKQVYTAFVEDRAKYREKIRELEEKVRELEEK